MMENSPGSFVQRLMQWRGHPWLSGQANRGCSGRRCADEIALGRKPPALPAWPGGLSEIAEVR